MRYQCRRQALRAQVRFLEIQVLQDRERIGCLEEERSSWSNSTVRSQRIVTRGSAVGVELLAEERKRERARVAIVKQTVHACSAEHIWNVHVRVAGHAVNVHGPPVAHVTVSGMVHAAMHAAVHAAADEVPCLVGCSAADLTSSAADLTSRRQGTEQV
mmetsp:Transcript_95974/g.154887  ORF Transcript_95974/g.154887 Transcript_95974/m.154887 type:complete len:158 (+) Transcript_95974:1156-1629(+)